MVRFQTCEVIKNSLCGKANKLVNFFIFILSSWQCQSCCVVHTAPELLYLMKFHTVNGFVCLCTFALVPLEVCQQPNDVRLASLAIFAKNQRKVFSLQIHKQICLKTIFLYHLSVFFRPKVYTNTYLKDLFLSLN